MSTPHEPSKPGYSACPNCGSKNLRRVREGDNEVAVVQRRACKDCGTVFSPAVPLVLVLVTVPLAVALFAFAVWGTFVENGDDAVQSAAWITFLFGLCLVFATVQIIRHREPKIHEAPQKPREPKPWDNPRDDGE
jgi:hypothetical protein